MKKMKTYQDYLYQAKKTEAPESVKESHTKYLEEHARGEWPQHETGPLSLTEWHALCIRAAETGEPMITDNTEATNEHCLGDTSRMG